MFSSGGFLPRDHGRQPKAYTPQYKTSVMRSPKYALVSLQNTVSEVTGPMFGHADVAEGDNDLIHNFAAPGESALGERMVLYGRVIDENGRAVPGTLVEIWQANAGGRYRHRNDTYLAPVDPNFAGCGRTLTDEEGRYSFRTVRPGPYPWPNFANSWRPAHVHVSIFGTGFAQRLITQCYFEGDPLIKLCPIVQTIPDASAIDRLVARLDMNASVPFDSLAYRFDLVLRGRRATYFENKLEG